MAQYTITLSDEHAAALLQKISALPHVMDVTGKQKPQFENEAEYIGAVIASDLGMLSPFIPEMSAADKAIADAQKQRQQKFESLRGAIQVTKGAQ